MRLREERVAALLKGRALVIAVGEPWDFEGPDGKHVLHGRVAEVRTADVPGDGEVEIEVTPFRAGDGEVDRLIGRARYEGGKNVVEALADGDAPELYLFYQTSEGRGRLIGGGRSRVAGALAGAPASLGAPNTRGN